MYVEAIHKDKYGHMKHNLMASECYLKGGIEALFKFPCLDLCSLCIKKILQKPCTGWLTHLYFEYQMQFGKT